MSNKLPPVLVRQLQHHPHFDLEAFLKVHDTDDKVTSIRLNPAKVQQQITTCASFEFADLKPVPWCSTGYYLPNRPIFTLDPLFHAGYYYVQEASSMFLAHVIETLGLHEEPLKALDLCASPGGKSTLLQGHLHSDSLLVANEPIKSRVGTLDDNLIKWGQPGTVVANSDPSAFSRLPGYFDLLVVDAPCSGSGMMRKDPNVIDQWSEAAVKLCKERQQRILAESLPSLKTGGILMYSTCSYSKEENEEIVDWLIDEHGLESVTIPVQADWGITVTESAKHQGSCYRFYPHRLEGEGFFISVLRKIKDEDEVDISKIKTEKSFIDPKKLGDWVKEPSKWINFAIGSDVSVFPAAYQQDLVALRRVLYLKDAGVTLGKIDKNVVIPDAALALSVVKSDRFPRLELDLPTALDYLRKQALPASVNAEELRGWVLVCYDGVVLGWAKCMPGRINNYYPKEWRIAHL